MHSFKWHTAAVDAHYGDDDGDDDDDDDDDDDEDDDDDDDFLICSRFIKDNIQQILSRPTPNQMRADANGGGETAWYVMVQRETHQLEYIAQSSYTAANSACSWWRCCPFLR